MAKTNSRISRKTQAARAHSAQVIDLHKLEAREEAAAVTLNGLRLAQARATLGYINNSASAVHQLAVAAGGMSDPHEVGAILTGVENSAKLICRYADVIGALLECGPGFGNFAEEFEPVTEEHAA